MRGAACALASDPLVQEVARAELIDSGSAIFAVVAGFFAAAGARPAPLLGPVALLVAGLGVGVRAFDGRLRQPGLGVRRPRGFLRGEEVPQAARVAAPQGLRAVSVALAYSGSARFAKLVKQGVRAARDDGAVERAALLGRIASVGPRAFSDGREARSILAVAGQVAGGLLTTLDLSTSPDLDVEATSPDGGSGVVRPPWLGEGLEHRKRSAKAVPGTETILAVDAHGALAALSYHTRKGLLIERWQVELSLGAEPVLRGERRLAPGSPIVAPAPFGIGFEAGLPVEVFADGGSAITRDPGSGAAKEKLSRS